MNLMLIDGNSVGFAAQAGTVLTCGDMQTQGLYGFMRSVRSLIQQFPQYQPIVLWDGKAKFRFDLYPGYKDRTGKNKKSDDLRARYKAIKPEIAKAMYYLGIAQMINPLAEADDLAAKMTSAVVKRGGEVALITGDQDWLQLLDEGVMWHDHRKEDVVRLKDLLNHTGCMTTRQFVEVKALTGDTSDTIPGVGGIGKKNAPELVARWGSIYKFFEEAKTKGIAPEAGKVIHRFANNEPNKNGIPMQDAFERNMNLMDLSRAIVDNSLTKTTKGRFNEQAFGDLCAEFGFLSILNDLHGWLLPFTKDKS